MKPLRLVRDESAETQSAEPLWREVLGSHLRELRQERDETLAESSARAGISQQYLSEIERGVKDPSSEMISAVAGALDIGLGELTLAVTRKLAARGSYDALALAA